MYKSRKVSKTKSRKVSKTIIYNSSGKKNNSMNIFFDKIVIINLEDKTKRWNEVIKGFLKYGVKFDRYNALDGRAVDKKEENYKKKIFEKLYKIKIKKKVNSATASLCIGTIDILRNMVKDKLDNILICEDDMYFLPSAIKQFSSNIQTLPSNWDLLYLGCGKNCGCEGMSIEKTSVNKYLTGLNRYYDDFYFHLKYKDDLRVLKNECSKINKTFSNVFQPGGTWCYAFSRKGAKKFLNYIDNKVTDHIDNMIIEAIEYGILDAISFDPPIVFHMGGVDRIDTTIPWEW